MYFDEKFLKELGVFGREEGVVAEFLGEMNKELEMRVGDAIMRRCSVGQIRDFNDLERGDREIVMRMLDEFSDYEEDKIFLYILGKQKMQAGTEVEKEKNAVKEYLKAKMLQKYCPDLEKIVSGEVEKLKKEILGRREQILQML